jgi:hypothetical protein
MFGETEHRCNARIPTLPATFRYETQLAAPAARHFRRCGEWDFANELTALRAASDLVAGRRAVTFAARAAGR